MMNNINTSDNLNLYSKIKEAILQYDNIVVASHLSPDGDNIGSLIAMTLAIKSMGKNVTGIELDAIPKNLLFMDKLDILTHTIPKNKQLLITVDCAEVSRLGEVGTVISQFEKIINIDHHLSNSHYGDINIVNPKKSSTCELVYDIFTTLDINITKEIASSLFTGICTDTGRFLYDNVSISTFNVAGDLISKGADKGYIMRKIFQSSQLMAKKLMNVIIGRSEFYQNNKAVISYVTIDDIKKYDVEISEVDEVINYYRDCDGVELSCLIKEKEDGIYKISFRSKEYLDVNKLAAHFGGGGHYFASGCIVKGSLENVKSRIIQRLDSVEWK